MADKAVSVAEKRLLDVKVGELPSWIATCSFTPNGILRAVFRGYHRYYKKYIDVRKGGIGGISMVLTSYVILSYIWSFEHIKHDRRRKYH